MTSGRHIVSDAGPLISLEKITDGYRFIARLYDRIFVPPAVLDEVASGLPDAAQTYLAHYHIETLIAVQPPTQPYRLPEAERLHEGEVQAMWLALELGLPLLIEETVGRRVAQNAGLSISGIAGQIVSAYRQGLISPEEASHKLSELLQAGRISRKLHEALAMAVIEAPEW
jgi:predicted nucleic acid-binding protein